MKYIAIIGYGIVGGGITAVLEENACRIAKNVGEEVAVKYILDLRDFPDSPYGDRVVHSIDPILADKEVELVCETMGGSHPAFEYTMSLFAAGKSVVTSNKEVVATFGDELLAEAAKNGVQYLFEASVGGGIPVLRSFRTSLAGDNVTGIDGILNGTTNYILTRMKESGCSYETALGEAQKLGYAEANPTADVDGIDAQRKIIILTALSTGVLADAKDVYAETMRNITTADMDAAARLGGAIKLIASARMEGGKAALFVAPRIVPGTCQLAHINDVYNGVSVTTPMLSDILYYGRGAGRYPTAAAVVADVCAVLSGAAAKEMIPEFTRAPEKIVPFETLSFRYYLRVETDNSEQLRAGLEAYADSVTNLEGAPAGCAEYVIGRINAKEFMEMCSALQITPVSALRILD